MEQWAVKVSMFFFVRTYGGNILRREGISERDGRDTCGGNIFSETAENIS